MANLLRSLSRSDPTLTLDQYAQLFSFMGNAYPLVNQTLGTTTEKIDGSYLSMVQGGYKANGVVFACMLARSSLFSEARFQFRERRNGRPGDLFGTAALSPLEHPWANGTTGDLLSRAIQDVDLAGNFFATRRPTGIRRLRPDWVTIILGSNSDASIDSDDIDAEVIGFLYHPGGPASGKKPEILLPEAVAHWAPLPDPLASYRGMSWLTPVVREVMGDSAATEHKIKFFENGATPNMVVSLDPEIKKAEFLEWVKTFKDNHEGVANAYKTLIFGAGAKVEVVGSDLKQLDFKMTQGAGETRIAAAAGVPPVIVGLSEGLQAATYSNYGQARRRYADLTMRPLWRSFAGSIAGLVDVPTGAELWYDDRDIPFLQEDLKDTAEIQQVNASAIRSLIDAGFDPASVVAAITANDLSRLTHTGLYSVQLQPPNPDGTTSPQEDAGRSLAALISPFLKQESKE